MWTRHQNWRHLNKTQNSIGKEKVQHGMLRHRQSTKRTTHSSCRKGKSGTASDDGDGRQQHWKNRQNSPTKSRFITFLKTALGLVLTIFSWLEELKNVWETIQFYWSCLKPYLKWTLDYLDIL